MDDVFNSGLPAWKSHKTTSRLERIEQEIREGKLKVHAHHEEGAPATKEEKRVTSEAVV